MFGFVTTKVLEFVALFGFVMAGASFIWNMSVDMFGFVSADLEFVAVFGFVTSGALCHLEFVALFGFITTEKLFHLKFVAFFRFAMAEVLFHLEFVALLIDSLTIQLYLYIKGKI